MFAVVLFVNQLLYVSTYSHYPCTAYTYKVVECVFDGNLKTCDESGWCDRMECLGSFNTSQIVQGWRSNATESCIGEQIPMEGIFEQARYRWVCSRTLRKSLERPSADACKQVPWSLLADRVVLRRH